VYLAQSPHRNLIKPLFYHKPEFIRCYLRCLHDAVFTRFDRTCYGDGQTQTVDRANLRFPSVLFILPNRLTYVHPCKPVIPLVPSDSPTPISSPLRLCAHVSFGARSFNVAARNIWNSLPSSLRNCTDFFTTAAIETLTNMKFSVL